MTETDEPETADPATYGVSDDPILALGAAKRQESIFFPKLGKNADGVPIGEQFLVTELAAADQQVFATLLRRRTQTDRIRAMLLTLHRKSGLAYPPTGVDGAGLPTFPLLVTAGFEKVDPKFIRAAIRLACVVNNLDPKSFVLQ